jgi:hypothetical protein
MRHAEDEPIHGILEVHVIQVIWKNLVIHISLQLTCPFVAALFLRLRCVAQSTLLRIEPTVSTPLTMAHVLFAHQNGLNQGGRR